MSAESILQRLELIKSQLAEDLPKAVAKEGMNTANIAFGNMTAAMPVNDDKGFEISGTTAMIAEFGAGTMTYTSHPFAGIADVPVYPGSYSEQHAKEFSTKGKWKFGGTEYKFIPPRMGMYYGMKDMQANLNQIAGEVFK